MRTQVKNYTFTAGTRQITVTDDITFSKDDIAVIVNRTQQKVLFTVPDYNLITDVTNKVITYDSSLPVLAENDVLWIEIDIEVSAQKIVYTPGDITVTPIQGLPDYYHDLAYEISQWPDLDYPYCYAILISAEIIDFNLYGANKYKCSDGQIYTSNQLVTIGANQAGREDKKTKFVIFRTDTPHISFDTTNYPVTPINALILGFYNYNCSVNNLYFYQSNIEFFINDDASRDPILFSGVRTRQALKAGVFRESQLLSYTFQKFRDDATDAEKTVELVNAYVFYSTPLSYIGFPEGVLELKITTNSIPIGTSKIKVIKFPDSTTTLNLIGQSSLFFGGLSQIIWPQDVKAIYLGNYSNQNFLGAKLEFPNGLDNLTLGSYILNGSPCKRLYISNPSINFSSPNATLGSATSLSEVELGNNFSYSIYLNGGVHAGILGSTWETKVFAKLLDLRSTNAAIPYVKITAGALTVWDACTSDGTLYSVNGDNAKFTTIFRVGQVVIVNISGTNRSYIIASIQDDNKMTMTSSNSMVAGTYLLNHNKIVTINPTDLGVCSAANKAVATNKLWQLVGA